MQPADLPALLGAFIRTGDLASDAGVIFAGQIPEYWHVRWAIFDVLDRIPATQRPRILRDIAARVFAPRTIVNVLTLIEELRNKENKHQEFTDQELEACKAATAQRIKTAAASGEISGTPENLSVMLYAWREWGDPGEARAYIDSITVSDEGLIQFVNRYVYQTNSAALSDKVVSKQNRLAMKQLSEAFDLNLLSERLSKIDVHKIKDEDREVVKFILEQMEKMRARKFTPEQFE